MTRAAYQANGRTIEREAFYALACDPRRSCVVEACAGAGKTWMLVSRILRALLDGAQAHEILAITFTRKAAGEMRERLNEWLRTFGSPMTSHATRVEALSARGVPSAAAETLAPELAGLHERVLREGRAVQVSTFHAWFAQLLRAAPLELLAELGLQQDMSLIEDLDEHRPEVFRRFHAAVLCDPVLHADHAVLIAQRGRSQVRAWFDAAWDKRVEFELADAAGVLEDSVEAVEGEDALDDATHPTWHPTHALHRDPWRSALRELASALGRGGAKAQQAAAGLIDALAHTEPLATFDACWNALFTLKREPRKLGQIALLAEAQDRLAALAERIHQHESRLEHLRMVRLTRVLLVELAGYKRGRGLAEMADLERCGLALLRDSTLAAWVQERLDARVHHVLIDEFQDTSPLQWHALHAWLAGYAGAGGGASGQRAPGVFIVGDPKQSIYRFRRAEPRVFEAARAFVVDGLGGDVLACDHTRRNAPEMLSVLNAVFQAAEDEGRFSGFRTHTTEVPADPHAGVSTLARVERPPKAARGAPAPEPHWRDSLTTPRLEADTLLREQEAARVADAAQALLREGDVRAGEVFVLSRKRQSLRLVAEALRHRQLPFAAVEEMALMEAAEARDLVALLDVLVSPSHRLSLAQTLRCPLFGCDDADLIALAERARDQTHGDWWAALVQGTDASDSPALARARAWLPRWREAAARLPPHDLLDRIVHEGGFRERVAATVPPVQRAAALDAIDAVLAQALLLDGARYSTPYNFVRALKRRSVKVAPPAHADAVQLLTVHGAKGLEAKVVFVMDAEPEPPRAETTTLLIDWPVDDERPRRCAFVYAESACPPSLQGLLAAEQLARSREELNGLYVAMSRAKQRLVFSATEPSRPAPGGSWWQRIVPHAQVLPVVEPAGTHESVRDEQAAAATSIFTLKTLGPVLSSAEVEPSAAAPLAAADDGHSRLGQAVHRVLEWASGSNAFVQSADTIGLFARAAAIEFDAPVENVAGLAGRILRSAAARRFFDPAALRWAGNEVPITDAGELLRIDRLVQLDEAEGLVWWVLDYKLQHAPQELPTYRDQLRRYRDAVRRLQAGAVVRCAFITGAGEVIALD
jgi:ATP-dependent helicase/nuclease subunit A